MDAQSGRLGQIMMWWIVGLLTCGVLSPISWFLSGKELARKEGAGMGCLGDVALLGIWIASCVGTIVGWGILPLLYGFIQMIVNWNDDLLYFWQLHREG